MISNANVLSQLKLFGKTSFTNDDNVPEESWQRAHLERLSRSKTRTKEGAGKLCGRSLMSSLARIQLPQNAHACEEGILMDTAKRIWQPHNHIGKIPVIGHTSELNGPFEIWIRGC